MPLSGILATLNTRILQSQANQEPLPHDATIEQIQAIKDKGEINHE
jgi:hypothetical protein